jgi:mRNA interferase YafQ
MREIVYLKKFKKDLERIVRGDKKRCEERRKRIRFVIECLAKKEKLVPEFRDHKLKGERGKYKDRREYHIEPDLLLVYKLERNVLTLERIGSHVDLFE